MPTILGIDPGSRVTGYGVIRSAGRQTLYLDSGCIRVGSGTLGERLRQIFDGVRELVALHRPDQFAIEQVFMHRNADSALKLGQARGAAIAAAVTAGLTLEEYQPSQIKQAVVGTGRATKEQVQHMVKVLLNLQGAVQADAADALAVALCHAHSGETLARIPAARRMARGRLR